MNKKKYCMTAAALLIAAGTMTGVCSAAEFTASDGVYTISGKAENINTNMLTVKVAGEDGLAHASYTVTDNEGNYTYTFSLADTWETGLYHAQVTDYDSGVVFEYDFEHADTEKQSNLIIALNNAKTVSAAKTALEECIKYYIISYPSEFDFNDEIKENVYKEIASAQDFTKENVYDRLIDIFAVSSLMYTDEKNIDTVIDVFADNFKFTAEKYYSLYAKSENKSTINAMFLKNSFNTLETAREVFNQITVLNEINAQDSHGGITSIFETCSDIMPESVKSLSSVEKTALALTLVSKDIYTIKELDDEAKNTAENSNNTTQKPQYSGSTGGGGSSSGGGRTQSSGISSITGNVSSGTSAINTAADKKYEFADVKDAEWAREAITLLMEKSVITGYDDGDFRPNNNITREEFVKIIVGAFGVVPKNEDCGFEDMKSDHWAYSYICTAKANGLINGISSNMFGTGSNITRQDMAVIISNVLGYSGISFEKKDKSEFTDEASIADYALESVHSLKASGIIGGYDDGSFRAANNATRAEAAQMIYNVLKYADRL